MKIGIITHFSKSTNYGGVLQAYALAKKLNDMGYDAEQISYVANLRNIDFQPENKIKQTKKVKIRRILSRIKAKLKRLIFYGKVLKRKNITKRKRECFNVWKDKNISSSARIYNCGNVNDALNIYDCFITGSDQVWNYNWYDENYFLDFVDESKIKISYAASLGHNEIPKTIEEIFEKHLRSFDAISVREENMVSLIQPFSPTRVQWVVDPVFLLQRAEWDSVISFSEDLKNDYIFCYFLGDNKKEREIVREYADKKGLKVKTIKDVNVKLSKKLSSSFADVSLADVDPSQFLFLVKNAKYVFTDSFHAIAFSIIYEKQFFVFNRSQNGEMNDRIKSILNLFNIGNRFCEDERENLEYVNSLENIDYSIRQNKFDKLKEQSVKFLKDSLGGCFNGW